MSDAPKTVYSPIRSPATNYHSTGMRNQTEYWSRKTIANYGLLTCRFAKVTIFRRICSGGMKNVISRFAQGKARW